MDFNELLTDIENEPNKPVSFQYIRNLVLSGGAGAAVHEINTWRVEYDPQLGCARYSLFDDRSSPHNDEYLVAEISYCSCLEEEPDDLDIILCKELMHIFDPRESWSDSPAKFIGFLKETQNTPLAGESLGMKAERYAKWMAFIAICPKSLRDSIKADVDGGANQDDIAKKFRFPDWFLDQVLDDYYNVAYAELTK